jgi:hypothetical protein
MSGLFYISTANFPAKTGNFSRQGGIFPPKSRLKKHSVKHP